MLSHLETENCAMKAELKELRSKVSSLLSSEEQLIGKLATSNAALEKVGSILYFFYREIRGQCKYMYTGSQSAVHIFRYGIHIRSEWFKASHEQLL